MSLKLVISLLISCSPVASFVLNKKSPPSAHRWKSLRVPGGRSGRNPSLASRKIFPNQKYHHSYNNYSPPSLTTVLSTNDSSSSEGDYSQGILLSLHLKNLNDDENNETVATTGTETTTIDQIRDYLRSFPFAAVLPVQPLTYLPSAHGVDVTFLRKKTAEKGSKDGGIIITVIPIQSEKDKFHLEARRNSEGQTVMKMFSEKIVVTELLKGIQEVKGDLNVGIESIFHPWM